MKVNSKQYSRRSTMSLMMAGVIVALGFTTFYLKSCHQVQASDCSEESAPLIELNVFELAPNYYEYSDNAVKIAQQNENIVLYFWAPWCSTCSSLDLDLLDKKIQLPDNVTMLRINYDSAKELKEKYNVSVQHTFVQIDKNGNPLSSWVGGELTDFPKNLK